ncbi:hypothetical protein CR201_G0054523 [Pongo abelii]|uniref:Uncharacterized protein n=1 Tax=Pongo abelii TaxID=9601 RepID=A0A2J8R2R1_PONAB|nr:hypothetical protein CR201_G0054523 [Pongo abelii]
MNVKKMERSQIDLNDVRKPSFLSRVFEDTWKCTLEMDLINVQYVEKPLIFPMFFIHITEITLKRKPININNVVEPSVTWILLRNRRTHTGTKLYKCKYEQTQALLNAATC